MALVGTIAGNRHSRAVAAAASELKLPDGATTETFDFDARGIDGWTTVSGRWTVEDMAGAPSGPKVLVHGRRDASGGIVFRFTDGKYYVVRGNALEDNFRLYSYDRGRRQLASGSVKRPALGQWHTVRVIAVGDRIQALARRHAASRSPRRALQGRWRRSVDQGRLHHGLRRPRHSRHERSLTMHQPIAPIAVRPWTLNGISERMLVSHYENNYGGAVRTLNAVRAELATLDASTPPYRLRALKREELSAMASVTLHEVYFGNLGGEGNKVPDAVRAQLEEHFGSLAAWRREFVGTAQSLAGGSGWALLTYSRRDRRLYNQIALDHTQSAVDAAPVLVLDMYEHAYHVDFGANATAYIDAFMRNVDWAAVTQRVAAVTAGRGLAVEDPSDQNLPSMSVEELAAQLARGEAVQVLDARPRHHISRTVDLMEGAVWRDPDRVDEWIGELSPDAPVAVYCAYGFHVGCNVTRTLREKGFDARYIRGGIAAWYATGGARALRT